MLKAELHNKLADDGRGASERAEDVLTSNVFGALAYVPASLVLVPWLRRARPFAAGAPPLVDQDEERVALHFWPRVGTREIDLVATPSRTPPIGVECKYLSGKSNHEESSEDESDQLAYYLEHLRDGQVRNLVGVGRLSEARLLYVTALSSVRDDLAASAQRCGPAEAYYALSWQELTPVLDAALRLVAGVPHREMLLDLRAVLERKGLRSFEGFAAVGSAPRLPPWSWRRRWALAAPSGAPWKRGFKWRST